MTRDGHMRLDTTQEFNWPKRVRCNICGRYLKRGLMFQVEHQYEKHPVTVEWKPLSKKDLDEVARAMSDGRFDIHYMGEVGIGGKDE